MVGHLLPFIPEKKFQLWSWRDSCWFSYGNTGLCLLYGRVFVLMFPFKVRKTNPNERAEKEACLDYCACICVTALSILLLLLFAVKFMWWPLDIEYFYILLLLRYSLSLHRLWGGVGSKVLPCLPCRKEDEALKKIVLHYEWWIGKKALAPSKVFLISGAVQGWFF